ncbi:Salicylaldehyde dehydrogenase [Ilyonectria robusta]
MTAPKSEPAPDLAMSAGAEKNRRLIAHGHSAGADIIAREKPSRVNGGEEKHRSRHTILVAVDLTTNIEFKKWFGPTVSLISIKSDKEVIGIANDTEYGHSFAVFSQDLRRAPKIAKEI